MQYGDTAREYMAKRLHAGPVLADLRDKTGLTVYLCLLRGESAVCVERIPGKAFDVLALRPGGALPLHLGAVGRVLLAFNPECVDEYLRKAPFQSIAPRTLTTESDLRADIQNTLDVGYALSDEDVTEGVGAMGVPVLSREGDCVAAISVAGPRSAIVEDQDHLSSALRAAASTIGEFHDRGTAVTR